MNFIKSSIFFAAIMATSINAASNTQVEVVQNASNATQASNVSGNVGTVPHVRELTVCEKIAKIMELPEAKKFGDLKEEMVKSILSPSEWGRVDYHDNDEPLSVHKLDQVMRTPSGCLSIDGKINRILDLGLKKFGDLKQSLVQDILTAEEWGLVDYHNNEALLTREALEKVLRQD